MSSLDKYSQKKNSGGADTLTYFLHKEMTQKRAKCCESDGCAISQGGVNAGVRNTQGSGKKLPGGEIVLFRNKSCDNEGKSTNKNSRHIQNGW